MRALLTLAGLRGIEELVEEEARKVPVLNDILDHQAVVVGVGRTETHPDPQIDDYYAALGERGINIPVYSCDIRKPEDVLLLIQTLLSVAGTLAKTPEL